MGYLVPIPSKFHVNFKEFEEASMAGLHCNKRILLLKTDVLLISAKEEGKPIRHRGHFYAPTVQ